MNINKRKNSAKKTLGLVLFFSILFLISPFISGANVQIEKQSSGETLIGDLNNPVTFNLSITNLGSSDTFEIYNLVGFSMNPGQFSINGGETKEVLLEIAPISEIDQRGFYTISYFIKRKSDGAQMQERLTFRVISLNEAFEIGSEEIDPEEESVEIFIKNVLEMNFKEINAIFSSPFFEVTEEFSLNSKETKKFDADLNHEEFRHLTAGFYTMTADLNVDGKNTRVEDSIKFIEKDIVTTTDNEFGFVVNTQTIEKINEGNVIQSTETTLEKNIISRLFTSFSPEPTLVERDGAKIRYTWINEISPGETQKILVKTNWLFPFLIIILIVAIVALTKKYNKRDVILRKKVSFVKAKGGEFALKVSILVHSKKYVERINIVDRLPPLVKIYEKFGADEPSRIDEKNKRIEWNFEKLESGETRILSYVIYSKVGVLGKFALPTATAIYEKEGEIHESESNRAFFIAEQSGKKSDDFD